MEMVEGRWKTWRSMEEWKITKWRWWLGFGKVERKMEDEEDEHRVVK